jgi:predicted choloylglycine hydrolase
MSGITAYFAPGVNFWVSIRYILDRCKGVEEAVSYLEEARHHCTITVLLAEPSGKMAVVETSPTMTRVRWPDGDHIVSTNHFNHPDMVKMKMFEPPDSRPRYDRCVERLQTAGELDEALVMGILSDHRGLVCSHRDEIGLGTLWSTVTHLNPLRVWRADGHPCTSPYAEDTRLRDAAA